MKKEKKMRNRVIKDIIYIIILITSILLSAYLGGWVMFIKPIIDCCKAFDNGTLTGLMVGISVIKLILARNVAAICLWVGKVAIELI